MINIEDLQEEVLNELFGTTNFASTMRGLFPANLFGNSSKPANPANERPLPKKEIERKVNSANRIQQASGFLSDKSLNDVDIPTFLRQAMVKGADASKPEQAALRSTGYKVGPPGSNKYGKVGGAADTVSAATMADAAKRRSVYANQSYASIRETQDQTIRRLLSEMKLQEWRVTPQLNNDPNYVHNAIMRTADFRDAEKNSVGGKPRKVRALKTAIDFLGRVADAHYAKDEAMHDATDSASWRTQDDNELYPDATAIKNSSVHESSTHDEALINRIVEELLEAFIYGKNHTRANPETKPGEIGERIPGLLSGMKFDTLQRALDAGAQRTPTGEPMGDWSHIEVAPDDPKPPVPLSTMTPDEHAKATLDPSVQPVAAPVK